MIDLLVARAETHEHELAYVFQRHGALGPAVARTERLTFGQLTAQACALACELQAARLQGRPILLLFGSGLDFIRAYCACLMAGSIATPLRPPLTSLEQRQTHAIGADSRAAAILTSSDLLEAVRALFAPAPSLAVLPVICADRFDESTADRWQRPPADGHAPALIQYTSGSTGAPKGVLVSHANLLANEAVICEAFGHDRSTVVAGWLPMFHDMGLIGNVLQPLYVGVPSVLMDPLAFVQKPLRWLQLISEYRATTSGGPNFAYELCARRVSEEEKQGLDLSSWTLAFSGAEPVKMDTMRRFVAAFSGVGYRASTFYPCYGLAESTLFVTGIDRRAEPNGLAVDRLALGTNRVEETALDAAGSVELACCGTARRDQIVRIVDPSTRVALHDGAVGEIWLAGASTAGGYLHQPDLTAQVFRAKLDTDDGRTYLRTGDLGFQRDGQLYVSGRLKDIIIVRGRNHYPQDIESTVASVDTMLRPGCGAAFAVDAGNSEGVVVIQEIKSEAAGACDISALLGSIRAAVSREHGLQLHDVALVEPRAVPKTSSGKIQRQLCRTLYETGGLKRIEVSRPANA